MDAINFIKETHKHYLGDIDINVKDENDFTYYDYAVLHEAIDDDHYVICPNCINGINKTKCLFGEGYYTNKDEIINCTVCDKKLDLNKKFHVSSTKLIDIYNTSDEEEIFKILLDVLNRRSYREDFMLKLLANVLNCKPKEKEKLSKLVGSKKLRKQLDKDEYKLPFIKFCIGSIDNIDDIHEILSFTKPPVHYGKVCPHITFTKNNINYSAFSKNNINSLRKSLKCDTIKTLNYEINDFIHDLPYSYWRDEPDKVPPMIKTYIKFYMKRYANVMKLFDNVNDLLNDCGEIFNEINEKYDLMQIEIIDDVKKYIEKTLID